MWCPTSIANFTRTYAVNRVNRGAYIHLLAVSKHTQTVSSYPVKYALTTLGFCTTDAPLGPVNKRYSSQRKSYPQDFCYFDGWGYHRNTILAECGSRSRPLRLVLMPSVEFQCLFSFKTAREKTHIFEPTPPIEAAQKVTFLSASANIPLISG